jgi:hypothetical protein
MTAEKREIMVVRSRKPAIENASISMSNSGDCPSRQQSVLLAANGATDKQSALLAANGATGSDLINNDHKNALLALKLKQGWHSVALWQLTGSLAESVDMDMLQSLTTITFPSSSGCATVENDRDTNK